MNLGLLGLGRGLRVLPVVCAEFGLVYLFLKVAFGSFILKRDYGLFRLGGRRFGFLVFGIFIA